MLYYPVALGTRMKTTVDSSSLPNKPNLSRYLNLSHHSRPSGVQRSAGDVLNDIGSMLADLTDELDAMLHMEAKQS